MGVGGGRREDREALGEDRDMHIDYPSILEGSAKLPQGSAKLLFLSWANLFLSAVVACHFCLKLPATLSFPDLVMVSRATVNCKLVAARSGGLDDDHDQR